MSYPQPGTPYAFIYFGGSLVTGIDKPNLLSFEYERGTTKGTNIARFTIIDEEWVEIEKKLANGKGKFSFSYGWADGTSGTNEGETWSPRYELALTKYQIKICNEHVQLSAQGKSPGHNLSGPPTVQPNTNKTGPPNYHEALKKFYNDNNIETLIWDKTDDNAATQCKHNTTLPKSPPTNLCSVSPNQDVWNNGDHSATFNDGKSGGFYRWFIDSMGKVQACNKNRENPVVRSNVRRYSVPDLTGKNNNDVISFEPDFDLPAMLASDNLASRSNFTVNKSTGVNETTQVAQDEGEKENPYNPVTSLSSKQLSDGGKVNTTGHSYNEYGGSSEQLRQANVSFYNQRATFVNRATLVLVGDPTLRICDSVFVTVNQTGKGAKGTHYTTGEWLVVGIKDSIQPGNYQTTLTLKKLRTPPKAEVETTHELTELPNTTENYGVA